MIVSSMQSDLHKENAQRGQVLIEILLGLVIITGLLASSDFIESRKAQEAREKSAAAQIIQFTNAVDSYIRANRGTPTLAEGTSTALTPTQLSTAGFLPQALANGAGPFGQELIALVNVPTNDSIRAIAATHDPAGGPAGALPPLTEIQAARIATMLGPSGGYVRTDTPANIRGVFGGWDRPISDFQVSGSPVPDVGDLAILLTYGPDGANQDFMHRGTDPGFLDANRMMTDLTMSGTTTATDSDSPGTTSNEWNSIVGAASVNTNTLTVRQTLNAVAAAVSGALKIGEQSITENEASMVYGLARGTYSGAPRFDFETNVVVRDEVQATGDGGANPALSSDSNDNTLGNSLTSADIAVISGNINVTDPNGEYKTTRALRSALQKTVGSTCSTEETGLLAYDNSDTVYKGRLLSCESGRWRNYLTLFEWQQKHSTTRTYVRCDTGYQLVGCAGGCTSCTGTLGVMPTSDNRGCQIKIPGGPFNVFAYCLRAY